MSDRLTRQQTAFLLSFLANLGSGITGSGVGSILYGVLLAELARLRDAIGRWEIVWGPAVFQAVPGGLPANVVYIARNREESTVVLAMAGTNPSSVFDWFIEDWLIEYTVPWPYGTPPEGAAISEGSDIALAIVQSLVPAAGLPGENKTVLRAVRDLTAEHRESFELVTTGHSLGGALSPALALWLSDVRDQWDPNSRASISNWAFAGPTTGTRAFSDYVGERLPKSVHRIWNNLDATPLGWDVRQLQTAKALYAPEIPEDPQVTAVLSFRQAEAVENRYAHVQPDASPLEGRINTGIIDPLRSAYSNYHTQSGFQHVDAYFELLGLPQYISYVSLIRLALTPLAVGQSVRSWLQFMATYARNGRRRRFALRDALRGDLDRS